MHSFISYLNEEQVLFEDAQELFEKLITFGGKAYPKFGNIVIMAGGAGSGKGFVLSNLVGVEGKVLDVDALKTMAAKAPLIRKKAKEELGKDLEYLSKNLGNPENTAALHDIIGTYMKLDKRVNQALYTSAMFAAPDRKPNIIFDVTLKDLQKLQNITRQVSEIGYDKSNIHIVWVVNDIEVAKQQNLRRDRTVGTEILVNTHRGAANTMGDIINMGKSLRKYMDGDIIFAFNKVMVDSELVRSGKGGSFVKDANFVYVKRQGKPPTPVDRLETDIKAKIKSYVPKGVEW
jgi:hypothetical protein